RRGRDAIRWGCKRRWAAAPRAPPRPDRRPVAGSGERTPARRSMDRGLLRALSPQLLHAQVVPSPRDGEVVRGNLLPARVVERLGGEADPLLEGCPVQAGGLEAARPADADELIAVTDHQSRDRGAIQSVANGV